MQTETEILWVVRHSGANKYAIVMARDEEHAHDLVRDRYKQRVIIYQTRQYDIDEAIKLLGFR